MMLLALDFETFYDSEYSLSKMTTAHYIRDPRFETIGLSAALLEDTDLSPGVEDDVEKFWIVGDSNVRSFLTEIDWKSTAASSHHKHFDGAILAWRYGVVPAYYYDTLSMGRALHGVMVGGSLAKLMEHYQLGAKGEEVVKAKGKRLRDFTKFELEEYGAYCRNDVRGHLGLLARMLPEFPQDELDLIDITVRMFTQPQLGLHETRLRAHAAEEEARKQALLERIASSPETLRSDAKFAELLVDLGVSEAELPKKWSEAQQKEVYAFAKGDAGLRELSEHPEELVQTAVAARLEWKTTASESRIKRLLTVGSPIPIYLNYAGAHTYRWSGGDKMNPQNWERPDPDNPRKGAIRRCLLAPKGYKLVVRDSGAIEARVTAWLAGQDDLVERFAKGEDVYSQFASKVYGRPIDRKRNKADKLPGMVGKVSILGLGYGMGWKKASMVFASGPMGAAPIVFTQDDADKLKVKVDEFWKTNESAISDMLLMVKGPERAAHCAVVDYLVRTYRKEFPKIVEFWDTAAAFLDYMLDEEQWFATQEQLPVEKREWLGAGVTFEDKKLHRVVTVVRHGLLLPNGMVMRYPGLTKSEGSDRPFYKYLGKKYAKHVEFSHLYGALLVENMVQALARIVVADQMLRLHRMGYHVAHMAHDEIVLVVPEAQADEANRIAGEVMKTPPAWAVRLPLTSDGAVVDCYGDAK